MSVMVAFLPYDVDAEDIAREGGLPVDELHVTSRYYGKKPDPQMVDRLRDLVIDIGASFAPFVADITAQGNLGKDDALVLHLASPHGEFEHARDMLPEPGDDVTTYPGYTPHLTLGYKMAEDEADQVDDSVGIKFDRIALAEDGDWFVVQLDGDRPPIVAALDLSDERLGDLLTAYGTAVTDVLPDGSHLYNGPTIDDIGVQHPSEPVAELIREVLRLRDVAEHHGAAENLVRRSVLGRCPECGADWRLTELVAEANHGGGYRVRCHDCDHEWDDPKASHGARVGADDPDYGPMMLNAGYDDLTEWKEDDMPMARVAGVFKLFTKKPKGKTPVFTKKQRDEMAESGEAMSNGEYPIRDKHGEQDLANAVAAIGRAKDRAAVEAHIRKRAKALGLTDKLPPWIRKESKTAGLEPGWGYATDNDVHVEYSPSARTAAVGRGRGRKKQKCFHGTPTTCKSVKFIRAYTAMRHKGYSKEKSARIANSLFNHWRSGIPRKGDRHPIVRKAFP